MTRVLRPYNCASIKSNDEDPNLFQDVEKQEGEMNASAVDEDTGFQAALSRSWDKLSVLDGATNSNPFGDLMKSDGVPTLVQPGVITHEETEENFVIGSESPSPDIAIELLPSLSNLPTPTQAPKVEKDTKVKSKRTRTRTRKKVVVDVSKKSDGFKEEAKKLASVWDQDPKWFFLQVKPGCEQSCAISLRNLGKSLPELGVKEVLVPAMKIMRLTKAGKSVNREERIYPSYILIHMCMNFDSYSQVRNVPNVQFFMGDPNRDKNKNDPFMPPIPISNRELSNVFNRMKSAEKEKPEARTVLRPGNSVRVLDGEYEGIYGTILEVKPDLNSITVELIHFARKVKAVLGIASVVKEDPPAEEDLEQVLLDSKGESMNDEDNDDDDGFSEAIMEDNETEKDGGFVNASLQKESNEFVGTKDAKVKKPKHISTVLDALDGPDMMPAAVDEDFDDLFVDDLPDVPVSTRGDKRLNKNSSKGKDPVQELLDLFDDEDFGGKDDMKRSKSGY